MQTLDIVEAAEWLKCGTDTVQQLAASGQIPAAKVGRAWVFVDVDLVEWLRSQYKAPEQPNKAHSCSTNVVKRGMSTSSTRVRGLDELLDLPQRKKPGVSTMPSAPPSGSVTPIRTPG